VVLAGAASACLGFAAAAQARRAVLAAGQHHALLQWVRARPQGLSLQELATRTQQRPEAVQALLGELYVAGLLDMEVTDQGELIYTPRPDAAAPESRGCSGALRHRRPVRHARPGARGAAAGQHLEELPG
jgi:hypothetical protein